MESVFFIVLLMGLGLGTCAYIIAADPKRYLARFGLDRWNARQYQAMLSNFLQAIHDEGLPAWPRRQNALSAWWFGVRVRRIIQRRPTLKRAAFIHHHLNLRALLKMLKPFIDDQILASQVRIVVNRLIDMPDTADRDRLAAFVERAEEVRTVFQSHLASIDRQVQTRLRQMEFLPILGRLHAIFLEHGYCLLPQLDNLRRWEGMEGSELVQELPALVLPKESPIWTGQVMHFSDV